ncbi:MAG: hypothetical protein U0838_03600 [Chloroflexota bacterium]
MSDGVLFLVPARAGSVRIPGKNLRTVGIPLVARAVRAACQAAEQLPGGPHRCGSQHRRPGDCRGRRRLGRRGAIPRARRRSPRPRRPPPRMSRSTPSASWQVAADRSARSCLCSPPRRSRIPRTSPRPSRCSMRRWRALSSPSRHRTRPPSTSRAWTRARWPKSRRLPGSRPIAS